LVYSNHSANNEIIDFFLPFLGAVGDGTTDTSRCVESTTHDVSVGEYCTFLGGRAIDVDIDGTTAADGTNESEVLNGEYMPKVGGGIADWEDVRGGRLLYSASPRRGTPRGDKLIGREIGSDEFNVEFLELLLLLLLYGEE